METSVLQNKVRLFEKVLDQLVEYILCLQEEGVDKIEIPLDSINIRNKRAGKVKKQLPSEKDSVDIGSRTKEPSKHVEVELDKIVGKISTCVNCSLHKTRKNTVPGQGSYHPDILFIGEGPGREEDCAGIPFIGKSGKLLTKIIEAMGYTREDVFIGNIVKCRPPDNRKPLPDEIEACLPYLNAQIKLLNPQVIVTLGATAIEGLTGRPVKITQQRGVWMTFAGIPLMPTFHPSYLFRVPSAKRHVWNDMKDVLKRLGRTPPPSGKITKE